MKIGILMLVLAALRVVAQSDPPATFPPTNSPIQRIEGQISITNEDAETVPMSLVTVKIVENTNFLAAIQQVSSYQKAANNDAEWRERVTRLVGAMPTMSKTNRAIAEKTYAQLSGMVKTNLPFAKLGKLASFEQYNSVNWREQCSIQTDAEGKFSVEVPPGTWNVVVLSKRKITEEEEEELVWFVDAPPTGRMLLNDSNLFAE